MDRTGSRTNRLAASERYFLDAVVELGHVAPRKLAFDEALARMLADAEQLRQLPDASPDPIGVAVIAALRQRVGQGLVRLGTRLQGTPSSASAPIG
jgi:hypothetical protein